MRFEGNKDYYSDYDTNTFVSFANLQNKITKLFVDTDLLNAAIFWFTNIERRKHNLKQFEFHNKLQQTATLHSEQMKRHNFFDHENAFEARYKTLTDRINSVKDNNFEGFMSWGENIADYPVIEANKTFTIENRNDIQRLFATNGKEIFPYSYYEFAKNIVEGWMNSPGHRANILKPDYEYLGCGCAMYEKQNNGYSMLHFKATQNFGGSLIDNEKNIPEYFKSLCSGNSINLKQKFNDSFGDLEQKNIKNMSKTVFYGTGENPDNGQEKTLCVFLLDTSSSMGFDTDPKPWKIDRLNNGLSGFKIDILKDRSLSQRLEVAVITFDSSVKCLQDPALVENFEMPVLTASGGTDMVGGIQKAIEVVKLRKKYYDDRGIPSKRPWIVMITDGEANVDSIKAQVEKDGEDDRYCFLPIAADDGADMDVLNSLVTKKVFTQAFKLDGCKFSEFFQWLNRSLNIIATAKIGDNKTLENPFETFAVR